ncbi:5967_t:CDS:2 [Paraglomus occultum]|uniref:5967_t:CDS:1 n=1 Tax=Paraglomus occultum TaxID=144539 RepID=A0A9N9AD65_9GLOM|nr:5967_t:CDS:2 [Paraglomus occultum]
MISIALDIALDSLIRFATFLSRARLFHEHYITEWLGDMVIIEYDSELKTYRLPKKHACINWKAGPDSLAVFVQYTRFLDQYRLPRLLDSFEKGCKLSTLAVDAVLSILNTFRIALSEEVDEYDVTVIDPMIVLMQDINTSTDLEKNVLHPLGPSLYTISTMYFMAVSLAHNGMELGTCWSGRLATLKQLKNVKSENV